MQAYIMLMWWTEDGYKKGLLVIKYVALAIELITSTHQEDACQVKGLLLGHGENVDGGQVQ